MKTISLTDWFAQQKKKYPCTGTGNRLTCICKGCRNARDDYCRFVGKDQQKIEVFNKSVKPSTS